MSELMPSGPVRPGRQRGKHDRELPFEETGLTLERIILAGHEVGLQTLIADIVVPERIHPQLLKVFFLQEHRLFNPVRIQKHVRCRLPDHQKQMRINVAAYQKPPQLQHLLTQVRLHDMPLPIQTVERLQHVQHLRIDEKTRAVHIPLHLGIGLPLGQQDQVIFQDKIRQDFMLIGTAVQTAVDKVGEFLLKFRDRDIDVRVDNFILKVSHLFVGVRNHFENLDDVVPRPLQVAHNHAVPSGSVHRVHEQESRHRDHGY